jgi:tRNA(Ile)-lysidine synthetase-like protein
LIESLRQAPGKFVSTSPAISVTRDGRGKIKLREERGEKFCADERLVKLQGRGGQVDFKGERFKWRITATGGSEGDFKPSSAKPKREYFDADKIGGRVILRHWRMGDRFRPIGMKAGAKLQDLFVNAKIPRHRRHELVVAVAVTGEIFWVQGLRIAENFKLTPRTRRKLAWEHRGL